MIQHQTAGCTFYQSALNKLPEDVIKRNQATNHDNRLKGAVALAPGFVSAITVDSLKTPTLVLAADSDRNINASIEYLHVSQGQIKNATYHELIDTAHFSFFPLCRAGAEELLGEDAFVCKDGSHRSRADIHTEVTQQIINFIKP